MVMTMVEQELLVDWEWKKSASCEGVDTGPNSIFFVEGYGATYPKARKYCSGCPVVIDCLIEAIYSDNDVGMWGCMSPNERNEVKDMLEAGKDFKKSAEKIWEEQRKKNGMLVPKKSIWKDWDA